MTREFKFRAWDKIRKERYWKSNPNWLLWYWFGLFWECMLVEQLPLDYIINLDITQYTGNKDRTWNEIYEGDVVQEIIGKERFRVCEVRFTDSWQLSPFYIYPEHSCWDASEVKIIWNIYENLDLIPN